MLEQWKRCGEKATFLYCCWECKLIQPLWKTLWRFLRKLNVELPYDPPISLLNICPDKITIQKDTCTTMFIVEYEHCRLCSFTTAKTWKQFKCPSTDEWYKKMWDLQTMEFYSAIKKKSKIMPFAATWMQPEVLILRKMS